MATSATVPPLPASSPPPPPSLFRFLSPVYSRLAPGRVLTALVGTFEGGGAAGEVARQALADRYPDRPVVLTVSGTLALQLAVLASAPHAPATVALPAYGCPDLGTAILGAKATAVLYDVNPHTLQPDWESVEHALQRGATHVVITHLYGRAADLPTAHALAAPYGAIVIEDSAQGADASLHGVACGGLADWSILSLGRGKGVNAGGGGVLLGPRGSSLDLPIPPVAPAFARDVTHAAKALLTEWLSHPLVYGIPARIPALGIGETTFHPPGPSGPVAAIAARLLPTALTESAHRAADRRAMEQAYLDDLADCAGVMCPQRLADSVSGALRTPVLVAPQRIAGLESLGVVRSYPRPLDAYPAIAAILREHRPLPGAALLAARTFTLPTHQRVTPADRRRIITRLRTGEGDV